MNTPIHPKRAASSSSDIPPHEHRHATYAAEATGLLLMAVVLLVFIVIRYWQSMAWNAH